MGPEEGSAANRDQTPIGAPEASTRETARRNESRTWWTQPSLLTALAALIAAMVPLTAAINGCFELQQQERLQRHEIRLKYLDRAIDPSQTPEYRERVLSFLLATLDDDDPMRKWASGESDILVEVLKLRDNVAAKEREITELRHELETTLAADAAQEQRLSERLTELESTLATERELLASKEREARVRGTMVVGFGPKPRGVLSVELPSEGQGVMLALPAPVDLKNSPTIALEVPRGGSVMLGGELHSNERGQTLFVPLPLDVLHPGWYKLTVHDGGEVGLPVATYTLELRRSGSD